MKLKDLINENLWNERKFGEPLPTLEDTTKAHQLKELGPDDFKGGKIQKMKFDKDYAGVGKDKLSDKDKEKAKKLGLVWKGKGYGKDGQDGITHKNVDGKLVKVDKGDGPNPTSQDSPLVKKDEPKKLSGKDFDRDLDSDDDSNQTDNSGNEIYTDGEIETIVDKDVDEIKAMLYGENPLAKYMSYKDDKSIQQHLDALKDVGQISPRQEDFHKDELYSVMSKAQQNMEMGKIKQGERFSGDRKFLPKSKEDKPNPTQNQKQYGNTTNQPTDTQSIKSAQDVLDQIKDVDMDDSFEEGPEGYETIVNALDGIKDSPLGSWEHLKKDIDNLKTNQGSDDARLLRMSLQSVVDKKDVFSDRYLGESVNPSDKYLTESVDLLQREFGQPLPTLKSVTEKHQKNIKEGPDDVKITKKQLQMLIKQEGEFRKRMLNIEQGFLRDPRPENKKLAKDIKKSYKDNVTKFMREVVGMLKRMK